MPLRFANPKSYRQEGSRADRAQTNQRQGDLNSSDLTYCDSEPSQRQEARCVAGTEPSCGTEVLRGAALLVMYGALVCARNFFERRLNVSSLLFLPTFSHTPVSPYVTTFWGKALERL